MSADHVHRRDQNSNTTLYAGLTFKETDNFLKGSLIELGSRQYSVATLGISHLDRMFGGIWVFDLAYNQELELLGATSRHALGAGDALTGIFEVL
nr:ShlB/FhaC/HecB family hemolysin secretion/activation protein [Brucella pituitosa]